MDALSSLFFLLHRVLFPLFTFRYPDEDVDSRSWRVCALLQHSTQEYGRLWMKDRNMGVFGKFELKK